MEITVSRSCDWFLGREQSFVPFKRSEPLRIVARAGALCMVIRTEEWVPEDVFRPAMAPESLGSIAGICVELDANQTRG